MNKAPAILLAIIFGNCISLTLTRTETFFSVPKDTLEINVPKDTLETRSKINITSDTTLHQSLVIRCDTTHYNLKMPVYKLKDDTFWEKMKEPWLGGILINIFFK